MDAIEADALILHLNPLQEALMDKGDTNFSGLLKKIENICNSLKAPIIVKEVGWGISKEIAIKLKGAGVKAIDVAGAGGTSWSEVEKFRNSQKMKEVANAFKSWGIPAAESLTEIRKALPDFPLIASGGIKDGVEIAKCLALGANLVGMARGFLLTAAESLDAIDMLAFSVTRQMMTAMFAVGAKNLSALNNQKISRIE
jgi:isopentenyl-diphosphate delta-isomerase